MNLMNIFGNLSKEHIRTLIKVFVYLFLGFLTLIATIASFGLTAEIDKVPVAERGLATVAIFVLALPQFFYTIYTIRWIVKKIFFKKK